jgi:protein-tyrosine-phosphatase
MLAPVTVELDPVTKLHVQKAVEALEDEFADVPHGEVEALMEDSLARLVGEANVNDFVSTLAYRFTRERLRAGRSRPVGATGSAMPTVLFVGLHDTGRGQMAAALAALRSEGRVVVHSAGSDPGAHVVDHAVVQAMSEIGADLGEAFPKPIVPEVLESADVVVTLGRSVGDVHVPHGTRHDDWRVGDPTGASVEEVRRIRDDLDRRVQALLDDVLAPAELAPAELAPAEQRSPDTH